MSMIAIAALMLSNPGGTMRANVTHPNPPPSAAPREERFLGAIQFGGIPLAVMDTTEVIWDGKPASYLDVPDEGTEVLSITINARRRVITRIEYVTKRDF